MPSLRIRIENLEKRLPPDRVPDLREEVHRRSFQKLSAEDIQTMGTVLQDRKEGICGPLNERESAAFSAHNAALELECQRAGFKSMEEFERLPARKVKKRGPK